MNHDIYCLFRKYQQNTCTSDEVSRVLDFIAEGRYQKEWEAALISDEEAFLKNPPELVNNHRQSETLRHRVMETAGGQKQRRLHHRPSWWRYAAIILLTISIGYYVVYWPQGADDRDSHKGSLPHISPGGNRAVLTLADGTIVDLSSSQEGVIMADNRIRYTDGTVVFDSQNRKHADDKAYTDHMDAELLSLRTPKGGQYRIVLADGTQVWLNAATTLTYPAAFNGDTREIEINGEAYFKVVENSRQPFRVRMGNQRVDVLGTTFHVSNYPDESSVKATLESGSIRVSDGRKSVVLSPSEQAVIQGDSLRKRPADVVAEIAWTTGKFVFNDESLESIIRKIARWYDVEVFYEDDVNKQESYGGSFSRFDNVSGVLKNLELTGGIYFNMEGRRITVKKTIQ